MLKSLGTTFSQVDNSRSLHKGPRQIAASPQLPSYDSPRAQKDKQVLHNSQGKNPSKSTHFSTEPWDMSSEVLAMQQGECSTRKNTLI